MSGNANVKEQKHIGALDGLRGLAVLLVLIFHFSWSFPEHGVSALVKRVMWSGWMGVDLFFVLSGYLITRGLAKESQFSVGKRLKLFWARRAFRIFPLYYIVLIVGTVACFALQQREHVPSLGYWLYFQNYTLAFDPMPLRWTAHFWSLAIEEQFYFVWPLFVLLVAARARLGLSLTLLVFSAVMRAVLLIALPKVLPGFDAEQAAKFVYRATPTHMDGLLVGALLAMLERNSEHAWSRLIARFARPVFFASLSLLLVLMVWTKGFGTYDRRVMIVGYPLLAVLFGSSVYLAANGRFAERTQKLLSGGFLASCGKVSYGMYIFHWFFIALLAEKQQAYVEAASPAVGTAVSVAVIVGGIAVTFALAHLSYRFIEARFLTLKERFHD
jgi:peptidoglycan/LPS O-acetylase OafA/YrhL